MTLTVVKTTALTGTITNAQLAGGIDLTSKVTGTLPIGNGGTNSTATTFVNATTNVTGALPIVNGGTGATSFSPGKLLQVVTQTKNSDSFTTGGFSTVFTCAITPSATSSKILVIGSIQYNNYGNGSTSFPNGTIQLLTNSDATLCRAYGNFSGNVSTDQTDQFDSTLALVAYDAPNSTSAQTYKVSYKAGAGRFGIMGAASNRNDGSSLTLIEIAA